jgi:predicted AlkP superfamily pyrophosphatase or phosphodiesterase
MKFVSLLVLSTLFLIVSLAADDRPRPPRLAVVIVVDQMRGDYVNRFGPYFTGGLRRLISEGAVFDSAAHEHANTETAVGHATLSTGCYPMHHGIVGNDFYDREHDTIVYSVDDTTTRLLRTTTASLKREDSLGASPHYLMYSALGNWLKSAGANNRVFSVSLKDRAAILMAGQATDSATRPDEVFWWDRKTGDFVTSTAYANALPGWVIQFNESPWKESWKDSTWTRIGDTDLYNLIGADNVPQENDGIHTSFPHEFTTERKSRSYFDALYYTPYADQLLIRFARQLVAQEHPGKGKGTDLLMISCSAADAVGHSFGPSSHEVFDHYLRLDKCLDTLFRQLDSAVGKDNYVVALSGDHGCLDMPVGLNRVPWKEFETDVRAAIKNAPGYRPAFDSLVRFNGTDVTFAHTPQSLAAELASAVRDQLSKKPYVAAVYMRTQIEAADSPETETLGLVRRSANCIRRIPDLTVVLKQYVYLTSSATGTSHGSPYWYDRHVPLVLWGHGINPQHIEGRVRTVDMAPTLAELLGFAPPDSVDGRSLTPVLHH